MTSLHATIPLHPLDDTAARRPGSRLPRRTGRAVAAALLAVAAAVPALGLTQASARGTTTDPAAAHGMQATPSTQALPSSRVLVSIFGPDWRLLTSTGEQIGLKAGSPSAHGLPRGYTVAVGAFSITPQEDPLQSFCTPMVEKGTRFGPCTLLISASSLVLQQDITPAAGAPATFRTLRLFHPRADGGFQIVDVNLTRRTSATAEQVAAADAWITALLPKLTQAVQLSTPIG